MIRSMVDAGAVDSTSGENTYRVDNFSLEQNAAVLRWLVISGAGLRLAQPG